MNSILVVVIREASKLSSKISRVPKEDVIKVFATDCSDQSLDEWMRLRRIGDGLDLIDLKDSKIRFPSLVAKQRVVIGAEILGNTLIRNDPIEHAAQSDPIDIAGMHTEADNASRELVHHDQHPVAIQQNRFTTK